MTTPPPQTPDRWTLDTWFTAFAAPDYEAFKSTLVEDIATLKAAAEASDGSQANLAGLICQYEALGDRLGHISAYLGCLSADDAGHEAVKADEAWISTLEAENSKLRSVLLAALAAMDEAAFIDLLEDPALKGAGHAATR